MPKYWGKQIFAHGRFPEVGQKQKTEKEKKERERKGDRMMVITMAKQRMAHASLLGQFELCVCFVCFECKMPTILVPLITLKVRFYFSTPLLREI